MKTKFTILMIVITLAATLLASCSNTTSTVSASSGLSTASRLALGTLKLEGTSQSVTASQAVQLLTLWQGYQSLSTSDTSSQFELDALVKQIESTMTSDQVKVIDAMDLTDQSVSETLETLDGDISSNTAAKTPSASNTSNLSNPEAPSGGPGGIAPSGDSSGMGDILGGASAQTTPYATQSPAASTSTLVNPMLLRALIQLLETRSQGTG